MILSKKELKNKLIYFIFLTKSNSKRVFTSEFMKYLDENNFDYYYEDIIEMIDENQYIFSFISGNGIYYDSELWIKSCYILIQYKE